MTMKIAILITNKSGGSGGFVKHLTEVVKRWRRDPQVGGVEVFCLEGILPELQQLGVPIRRVPRQDYRHSFRQMAARIADGGFDVALNTIARPVPLSCIPLVTMVQNIEPIQEATYPMPMLWRLRLWALRREHAVACRRATRVVAVSKHVGDEVSRCFQLPPEKIDVVYHGFDPAEARAETRRPAAAIPPEGFVFGAGSLVPYRGYEDVIRALAHLRAEGATPPCAVLAGPGTGLTSSYERSLKVLAASLKVSDLIVWTGLLQRSEMSWCFANAKVFVQTSRAESFSNIQVEAMGHGCLCISGDNAPMPEILADAADYYPSGDARALAARIKCLLELDKKEIDVRRGKALRRAAFFSWDRTADLTLDSLRHAIDDAKKEKASDVR